MVAKPQFSEVMEREGRAYAQAHPEERLRVLEACDEAAKGRISRDAEVLIWVEHNTAFVKGYTFWIHRNDDGEWEAKPVVH